MTDYLSLPSDLPAPEDDGAADHLPGMSMPPVELTSTSGERIAAWAEAGGEAHGRAARARGGSLSGSSAR